MEKGTNYTKFYALYKKMPIILAITVATLAFVWSIVDVATFQYTKYYYYTVVTRYYGVMHLPSAFLALVIWWLIGAVLAAATWFFSSLTISATVVRTDAVLEMNEREKADH